MPQYVWVVNGSTSTFSPSPTLEVVMADAAWGAVTGTLSNQTDLQAALDAKAASSHTHTGVYEAANANIQSHVAAAHAPSNAQKNSDITKAEIEAKLTGEISSHTHASGAGDMVAANNLSDVASAATAFANIKQAASTTATGVVELATDGENAASVVVQGNDARLSNVRTPSAHKASHIAGGSDIVESFPVGSVFIAVVSTNPGTLLGYGTWSAFAAGRVLVGIDAGQTEFDVVEETGGAKTHTLQTTEIPAHTHIITSQTATTGGATSYEHGTLDTSSAEAEATEVTGSTGGGGAHNNLQPYIVVYMWKRTA